MSDERLIHGNWEPGKLYEKFANKTAGMNKVDFMNFLRFPKRSERKYTEEEIIAFAKNFLRACEKHKVTPHQLMMWKSRRHE